jgi:flagellar protein FlbT
MALKVELKAGERFIVGDCVITNTDQRARLLIDGNAPILREKDILTPETANSPAKRIYFCVQMMYLSKNPSEQHETYFQLMRDIVQAAPSTWPYIENINNHILTGEMYKALKQVRKLIAYEQELFEHAKRGGRLPKSSEGDRQSA